MTTLLRATHTLASGSTYFAYVRREGDERDTTCAARVNTAFTQNKLAHKIQQVLRPLLA